MSIKSGQIANREWFENSLGSMETTFKLYRRGSIPPEIERFLLVTPLKYALRGVYGTNNLGVAWRLMCEAVLEMLRYRWYAIRFRFGYDPLKEEQRNA